MNYLTDEEFVDIYSKAPRLCVDLVIKNNEGILLGLRSRAPFEDMWNLPGGTVYKDEKIEEAGIRIAKNETGLDVNIGKCIGYIESLKEKRFDVEMHTISIILEVFPKEGELHCDENTKELKYFQELPRTLIREQVEFLKTLHA